MYRGHVVRRYTYALSGRWWTWRESNPRLERARDTICTCFCPSYNVDQWDGESTRFVREC